MRLRLQRFAHLQHCTLGRLVTPERALFTLELPWRDNRHNISCIPPGEYGLVFYDSPTKGHVYLLQGVPDRDDIELHIGNYPTDSKGCILVGEGVEGALFNASVSRSTLAMGWLQTLLGSTDHHSLSVEIYNPYSE